jgi:putative NIF3 family GTP cyclohydrolase 1 type 2
MTTTLSAISGYLDAYLNSGRFPGDQNGIYRASSRPIARIGLAVEPWPTIGEWVRRQRLDALLLHRPWKLDLETLPAGVGVLAYHLAFDLSLTTGCNPRLATALQVQGSPTPFAYKEGIAYGMFGDIAPTSLDNFAATLDDIFGATPKIETRFHEQVRRIAVVGAMTDAFVREAASHAIDLYITGQFRQPARLAVQETGMNVAVVGHAPSEVWAIRALAGVLRERWLGLEVLLERKDFH